MPVSRYAVLTLVWWSLAAPAFAQESLPSSAAQVEAAAAIDGASTEPAIAQLPRPGQAPPTDIGAVDASGAVETRNVFKLVGGDFKNFFSKDTARVMGFVAIAAVATAPWDREGVNNGFNIPTTLFESGNIMGSFMFQAGAGFAGYSVGRVIGNEKLATVGRDVVRAQILSQVLVQGVKVTIRRERPDGSNSMSFPSGHSASAFATAGVLHRHYGWKAGAPAYAIGSYVALARMAWNRHHATDVVMGAGFGLASARTVTMNVGASKFSMGVQPQVGGASLNFAKIYR